MNIPGWQGTMPKSTMNRSLDDFFNESYRRLLHWNDFRDDYFELPPVANVKEGDNNYFLEIAAPGFEKKDFSITVRDNILTISAETKESEEDNPDQYTRREFHYAGFSRSFTLPEYVEEAYITAKYEDGILKINVPRQKIPENQKKPRKVIIH